ncbi:MAG: hypothetical protein IKU27_06505, partial [Clostridia bacterium]|nr:hypothetical protein [Clostridia bacterium]
RCSIINDLQFTLKPAVNQSSDFYDNHFQDDDLFSRIMRRDITQIDLFYIDGSSENYLVCWQDELDNPNQNSLQTIALHTDGHLYVAITKNSSDKTYE